MYAIYVTGNAKTLMYIYSANVKILFVSEKSFGTFLQIILTLNSRLNSTTSPILTLFTLYLELI